MIAASSLKVYQELWHEMSVNHRVQYVDGIPNGIEVVKRDPGFVLLGPIDTMKMYTTGDYRGYLNKSLFRIQDFVEHGFIDKWVNDYARYVEFTHNASSQCANSTQSQVGYLSLDQAQGAFWLLIAGLLFSILILSIECIIRLLWGWLPRCLRKTKSGRHKSIDTSKNWSLKESNSTPSPTVSSGSSSGSSGLRMPINPVRKRSSAYGTTNSTISTNISVVNYKL
uniref:Uncharacterized protein n=1 Tax=Acrobeloides nanus TaxID=290746 RepID=A0A914DYE9_9BILA